MYAASCYILGLMTDGHRTFVIDLSVSLHSALKHWSAATETPMSVIVRRLIETELINQGVLSDRQLAHPAPAEGNEA